MNTPAIRDAEKVKAALKEVGSKVVALKDIEITFPVRYEHADLASMGSEPYFYGLFKISIDGGQFYAIHNCMASIHSEPSDIRTELYENEPYYILSYRPGDTVIKDVSLFKDKNLIGKVYKEFINKGKIPYFVNYFDACKIFETTQEYAGNSIGNTHEILAVPISIIARNPNDLNQYYREILDSVDPNVVKPTYVPSSSVSFGARDALTKITGSYFYAGVVSAINSPTEHENTLGLVLRY